jgi:hypothetical protein
MVMIGSDSGAQPSLRNEAEKGRNKEGPALPPDLSMTVDD